MSDLGSLEPRKVVEECLVRIDRIEGVGRVYAARVLARELRELLDAADDNPVPRMKLDTRKFCRVNRHTRAGRNGRGIWCPHCGHGFPIYGFDWLALVCDGCGATVPKGRFWVTKAK